jgi:hypothetical protein
MVVDGGDHPVEEAIVDCLGQGITGEVSLGGG